LKTGKPVELIFKNYKIIIMKKRMFLLFTIAALAGANSFAQKNQASKKEKQVTVRQLTIEPAIGIHTNFGTDLLVTNLVQWNPTKRLALAAHTSFNMNNPFKRNFNGIKTNYNYSINQKFGVGATFYAKKSSSTIFLMAGVKYTSFEETLNNPGNKKVTASVHSTSPDYGFMYHLSKGVKKYFFSFRMYVPLYPWPAKKFDITYTDGNMNNIALELGVGIKIK
jgi:hypothetical protein